MINFNVNEDLCVQCGLCTKCCPFAAIELDEYPRMADENKCIKCQQCLTVCPTAAISILGKSPEDSTALKGNFPEPEKMATLIKGRRSVRNYKNENVDDEDIKTLLDVCWHAPTGVNSQDVFITLMDDLESTKAFGEEVYRLIGESVKSGQFDDNFKMDYLKLAYTVREENGLDIIFRGAPHFVVASAPADSPCPVVDTHIFLSYFELMAQSMKLGTLWNGILKWAIDGVYPELRSKLGIPENHLVGHVMLLGKPAVKYQRTVERGRANVNRVVWK
ncbi:nitroreductase family protein [Maridesulfovibrio zosterae]|uniref:nitroreductase family protein n=1 Tax=Maridesulfovibrio zosterae TaxID=82171 RepID=UPI0003FE4577|nr:nitroreductase family protein [Maridesulfovibrio zosterae]